MEHLSVLHSQNFLENNRSSSTNFSNDESRTSGFETESTSESENDIGMKSNKLSIRDGLEVSNQQERNEDMVEDELHPDTSQAPYSSKNKRTSESIQEHIPFGSDTDELMDDQDTLVLSSKDVKESKEDGHLKTEDSQKLLCSPLFNDKPKVSRRHLKIMSQLTSLANWKPPPTQLECSKCKKLVSLTLQGNPTLYSISFFFSLQKLKLATLF